MRDEQRRHWARLGTSPCICWLPSPDRVCLFRGLGQICCGSIQRGLYWGTLHQRKVERPLQTYSRRYESSGWLQHI